MVGARDIRSMDLPRIASHTSISPTNIELLNYNASSAASTGTAELFKPRTPVSRRLLSSSSTTNEFNANVPTFNIIPGAGTAFQPNRKREEACALQNLKRRVQQLRIIKANQQAPVESSVTIKDNQDLDNRPQLFQKVLLIIYSFPKM